MKRIAKFLIDFFSSFGLAVVIFLLLLVLVFLGTLEQVHHGIFEVQKRYFDSFVVVHHAFGWLPIPLPGVMLLMLILAVNLILGGIVRMRKDMKRIGILIIHAGILFLLLGGVIQRVYATDGQMTLFEGQQASQYESYFLWEVTVAPANTGGTVQEYVIPAKDFNDLGPNEQRTFTADALPFDLTINDYMANCQPMPKGPMFDVNVPVINGVFLRRLEKEKESERNTAGFYATVRDKATGKKQQGIVWGSSWFQNVIPWTVQAGGKTWAIDLHKVRWSVPFTVKLDKFTHTFHPGTRMPASFASDITKIEGNSTQRIHIKMNKPLRYKGYTLYQASWGPQNAKPGDPLFSTFAVVRNPADKFPLYACVIISIGLVLHFSLKLLGYLRAETRRAAR